MKIPNAFCKTCGGIVPNHLPTALDADGVGHSGHAIKRTPDLSKASQEDNQTDPIEDILNELLGEKAPDFIPYYDPQNPVEAKANTEFAEKWLILRKEATQQIRQLIIKEKIKTLNDLLASRIYSTTPRGYNDQYITRSKIKHRINKLTSQLKDK